MDPNTLSSFKRQLLDKISAETRQKILLLLDRMDATEEQQSVVGGKDRVLTPDTAMSVRAPAAGHKAEQQPFCYEDGPAAIAGLDRDLDIFRDLGGQDATITATQGGSSSSSSSSSSSRNGSTTESSPRRSRTRSRRSAASRGLSRHPSQILQSIVICTNN